MVSAFLFIFWNGSIFLLLVAWRGEKQRNGKTEFFGCFGQSRRENREMNQPSPLKIAKMELQGLTMLYNTMVQECWSKCIPNTKEVSVFILIFSHGVNRFFTQKRKIRVIFILISHYTIRLNLMWVNKAVQIDALPNI